MALDRMLYRLTYRLGTPQWDTGVPQSALQQLVRDRAPGRALDLGCGTEPAWCTWPVTAG